MLQSMIDVQLSTAIAIAVNAHIGQYDKGGNPYILHPLHLMNQLMFDKELATIAVLQDVVEDTEVTLNYLCDHRMSRRVIRGVDLLTHKKEESYEEYIKKICSSYDAIRVKRKDLEHNSDITRLRGITEKDLKRMQKYHTAFIVLGKAKLNF